MPFLTLPGWAKPPHTPCPVAVLPPPSRRASGSQPHPTRTTAGPHPPLVQLEPLRAVRGHPGFVNAPQPMRHVRPGSLTPQPEPPWAEAPTCGPMHTHTLPTECWPWAHGVGCGVLGSRWGMGGGRVLEEAGRWSTKGKYTTETTASASFTSTHFYPEHPLLGPVGVCPGWRAWGE